MKKVTITLEIDQEALEALTIGVACPLYSYVDGGWDCKLRGRELLEAAKKEYEESQAHLDVGQQDLRADEIRAYEALLEAVEAQEVGVIKTG